MAGLQLAGMNAFNTNAIGYEEIIGADDVDLADFLGIGEDDDDDLINVSGKGSKGAKARKMMAALSRGVRPAQIEPVKGRYLFFGGRATQGAVTGSLDVTCRVQEAIRPQRMVISVLTDAAVVVNLASVIIQDILVGVKSQLVSLGDIPAVMFSGDSTQMMAGFSFDTVQPGTDFTVRFRSITALYSAVVGVNGVALR